MLSLQYIKYISPWSRSICFGSLSGFAWYTKLVSCIVQKPLNFSAEKVLKAKDGVDKGIYHASQLLWSSFYLYVCMTHISSDLCSQHSPTTVSTFFFVDGFSFYWPGLHVFVDLFDRLHLWALLANMSTFHCLAEGRYVRDIPKQHEEKKNLYFSWQWCQFHGVCGHKQLWYSVKQLVEKMSVGEVVMEPLSMASNI